VDGETYLRLLVERVVDDVGQRPPVDLRDAGSRFSTFTRVSEALVAAGAVDGHVAGAILSDLTLAVGLRTPHLAHGLEPHSAGAQLPAAAPATDPAPPPLRRVVRGCQAELEVTDGSVQFSYLMVEESGALLVATAVPRAGLPRSIGPSVAGGSGAGGRGGAPSFGGGVTSIRRAAVAGRPSGQPARVPRPSPVGGRMPQFDDFTVADDGGVELEVTGANIAGTDDRFELLFRLTPAPPPSTEALVFASEAHGSVRARLTDPVPARVSPLEDIPVAECWNPAERYLLASAERSFRWWSRSRAHGGVPTPPVEDPGATALVEIGALAPDSAAITMSGALARAGRGEVAPPGLPGSWASVLAHLAADDGLDATAVIGVALPPIGGREVSIDALTSEPDGWTLHVFQRRGAWPAPGARLSTGDLSYRASDDLGNAYVGWMDGGGGGPEGLSMRMAFLPRLDPAAAEVRLEVSAEGRRTTVVVPLPPPWGDRT
jgi:hypothetical protein